MTHLVFIITLVFLLSMQTTFLRVIFPGNVVPDLILIVAIYSSIHLKRTSGIWLAVLMGFLQDCLSGGLLGVNFLSKGLVGLFFCAIKEKIFVQGIIPIGFFVFAASLVDGMIYFASMTSLLGGQVKGNYLLFSIIIFGICNGVIAPFLFYMFDKGRQFLHRKFPNHVFETI